MKIYQVGGAVRDLIRGCQPRDRDYVVVGATPDQMKKMGFKEVGKGFPVFLHPDTKEEYALARKEIKIGSKHTDFQFIFSPDITLKEDLSRRDFTCNAIALDPATNDYIDYFGGMSDIKNKILRHINADHFVEDPLRVLRLCRFSAQLDFEPAPETLALCRDMVKHNMLAYLTPERVWEEFLKALSTSSFLRFLFTAYQVGALQIIFPEIDCLSEMKKTNLRKVLSVAEGDLPQVKFALLVCVGCGLVYSNKDVNQKESCEKIIRGICKRLRAPLVYGDFCCMVSRLFYDFEQLPDMTTAQLYDFAVSLNKKHVCYLEPYLKVMQAGLELSDKSDEDKRKVFEDNASLLRFICTSEKNIKAQSMPDFDNIPKDRGFAGKLRAYKIGRLEEIIHLMRKV